MLERRVTPCLEARQRARVTLARYAFTATALPDQQSASEERSTIELVADEVYSLLDAVDSESIADEFRTGIQSEKHDFKNHVKNVECEGS